MTSKPKIQQVRQVEEAQSAPPAPAPEPIEYPDSPPAHLYARIIDILGEGPIEGLIDHGGNVIVDRAKLGRAVTVNDTLLQNADGSRNFQGVNMGINYGTQDQLAMTGFGPAAETIFSGAVIKHAVPVTIGITNPAADHFILAIQAESLLTRDAKNGNISGAEVTYQIDIEKNGSGDFVLLDRILINKKASSAWVNTTSHRLPFSETAGSDSWVIKVTRLTADSTTQNVQNTISLQFITVYTKHFFRYPNTAHVGVEIDAKGFTSIPSRAYKVKGLIVRVPNNYDPETREYNRDYLTGDLIFGDDGEPAAQPWLGGFYSAWTDNPAWCTFDLLTSTRYGLGEEMGVTQGEPDGRVDKWSFYNIGRYCDGLVDNGFGTMERRFSCNIVLQSQEDAYKVIQDFCSIFWGMPYWDGGAIVVTQDSPKTPVTVFTNADVVDGIFTYSGSSRNSRHTSVSVRWNDPEDLYRPKVEYVEDTEGILRYGYRHTEVAGFAATSRSQAHRVGQRVLKTELNQTGTVSFSGGMKGALLRPGDIFGVLDNDVAGIPQGGRILEIAEDRLSLTLDRAVAIPAGTVTVTMTRPQGFLQSSAIESSEDIALLRPSQIVELTVSNAETESTTVLTFDDEIPSGVETPSIFVLKTEELEPQLFQLLGVMEKSAGEYEVNGLQHYAGKFDEVELGIVLDEVPISEIEITRGPIAAVTGLTLTLSASVTPDGVERKIVATWSASSDAVESYRVEYRLDSGTWTVTDDTPATVSEIGYTIPGTYDVRVTALATSGTPSNGVIARVVITDTNPIELFSVSGLELVGQGNATDWVGKDARFEWRINSPSNTTELGSEVIGADEGGPDPYKLDYLVEIYDVSGIQVYREAVGDTRFVYSYSKNSESPGGRRNQFRIEVRGRDLFGNLTPPAVLTVQNPAPGAPTSLTVTASLKAVYLAWINPGDLDLEFVEVFEGNTSTFADSVKVAEVRGTTFTRAGLNAGAHRWYWLRAVDTFGTVSALTTPSDAVAGSVTAADIETAAVDVTKIYQNVIALQGDVWLNHSAGGVTVAGSIEWNAHTVVFRGVLYAIAADDTTDKYVWWRGPIFDADDVTLLTPGETVYRTSATHPAALMTNPNDFLIATNAGGLGVYGLAWRFFTNAAIASAWIANLAADKITAGTMTAQEIIIAGGAAGILRSDNYVAGVSGWKFDGDGNLFANTVDILGTFRAGVMLSGAKYASAAYPTKLYPAQVLVFASSFLTEHFDNNDVSSPNTRVLPIGNPEVNPETIVLSASNLGESVGVYFYGPNAGAAGALERVATVTPSFIVQFECAANPGNLCIGYRVTDYAEASPDVNAVWVVARAVPTGVLRKVFVENSVTMTAAQKVEWGIIGCTGPGVFSSSNDNVQAPYLSIQVLNR